MNLQNHLPSTKCEIARTLAKTFGNLKALGVTDRDVYSNILRGTLECHPEFSGVWTVWEPNMLDGRDRDYVNADGHDETGRYIPLWSRFGSRPRIEPNTNYDVPGKGDYYIVTINRQHEVRFRPYTYYSAIDGKPRILTSQVAPIFYNGRCIGVAGFDILVDSDHECDWMHPRMTPRNREGNGLESLSPREREVLSWATQGKSNREIGVILSISAHTVKHHMASVLSKLGVENRQTAILCNLQSCESF